MLKLGLSGYAMKLLTRPTVLAAVGLLAACSDTPDCDADVTLTMLNAKIRTMVEARWGERLRLPAIAPGMIELNPRKLAVAARVDPVKIMIEGVQSLDSGSGNNRQCRAQISLMLDVNDSSKPIKKSGTINFSIRKFDPGFLIDIQPNNVATLLE